MPPDPPSVARLPPQSATATKQSRGNTVLWLLFYLLSVKYIILKSETVETRTKTPKITRVNLENNVNLTPRVERGETAQTHSKWLRATTGTVSRGRDVFMFVTHDAAEDGAFHSAVSFSVERGAAGQQSLFRCCRINKKRMTVSFSSSKPKTGFYFGLSVVSCVQSDLQRALTCGWLTQADHENKR